MLSRLVAASLIGLACLTVAGCGGPASKDATAEGPVVIVPGPRPSRVPPDAGDAGWVYREHVLDGSWRALHHSDGVALLQKEVRQKNGQRFELHLMDLETGRTALVRDRAVDPELFILGHALGERWVAWEEVCEGDLIRDPATVVWKLYLAPYDRDTFAVGPPRLIERAVLKARSRPQFDFIGTRLYVAYNTVRGNEGELRFGGGEIHVLDLASQDASRTLFRTRTSIGDIGTSEGDIIVTRRRKPYGDDQASTVEVVDGESGRIEVAFETPRPGRVAHTAAYHDGNVVWAELVPGLGSNTNAFAVSREGSMTALSFVGLNAGIAGEWAVFETLQQTTETVRTRSYAPGSQIYAVPLGGGGRRLLAEGSIAKGTMWLIAGPAEYRADDLVIFADGTQFEGDGKTRIRVYDVPPAPKRLSTAAAGG